jgi:hypothetical protein
MRKHGRQHGRAPAPTRKRDVQMGKQRTRVAPRPCHHACQPRRTEKQAARTQAVARRRVLVVLCAGPAGGSCSPRPRATRASRPGGRRTMHACMHAAVPAGRTPDHHEPPPRSTGKATGRWSVAPAHRPGMDRLRRGGSSDPIEAARASHTLTYASLFLFVLAGPHCV